MSKFYIISESSEDRFGSADDLQDAIRTAVELTKESQAGDLISIEHDGKIVWKFVLTPQGVRQQQVS